MLRRMNKTNWKLMLAGVFATCVAGGVALRFAWATPATPPPGFVSTSIVGPVVLDEIDTKAETDNWELELRTKGFTDVFVTNIKVQPGAHGGWHSHPGPSIISVKSGTATFYDDCDDFLTPHVYPTGTGFVEDAGCVHILTNEGTTDLEVIVMQLVPLGAPRRIDEPAP
jgi:quercetin dioxygenase-like cupin family protein